MIATNPYFSEAGLIRSICKKSFYEFVKEFWPVLWPDTKMQDNWHIPYLCNQFQEEAELVFAKQRKRYDLILINIAPGSSKSSLFSILAPDWIWTRMISARIIGASHTHNLALDLSRYCRAVVKSEKYHSCFPEFVMSSDQDAKGHFANTARGERNSCGLDGDITGRHADFIFVDDPLNPKSARSEADIRRANTNLKEVLMNRKRDKNISLVICIMQRLCENDPSGMYLKQAKEGKLRVKHICLPAELTDKVYPPQLAQYYQNGLMDEVRMPRSFLDTEKGTGRFYYAGQFLQSPVPEGGGMFLVAKVKRIASAPLNCIRKVRYWDKAGSDGKGAFTVGVKMSKYKAYDAPVAHPRFCVEHVVRGQWEAAERERIIKNTAISDGPNVEVVVEQEGGSGGKESASNTVRNLAGFSVRKDKVGRSDGDKIWRADGYATQLNDGNIDVVDADWTEAYLNELQFFPFSEYKDQVDASSGAFKLLNNLKSVGAW